MSKRTELLSPVGGMEQLRAAVRFGANAVYGGMKDYGLRAYAGNFDQATLAQAVNFAHSQGVRFYVTMNLLPTDRDMPGFLAAATQALEAGADAAIVSDLGAALCLREALPQLPLHISTQANVLNTRTALAFHQLAGAERIILSRELSLEAIEEMRQALPPQVSLEAFVHGAMCVAYSGRCLLSAALTGRSGNRGACAQPCRWQYHLVEEKRPGEYLPLMEDERGSYLFSAYDLCMLPHLPELRKAGVESFKIEGRMKSAYYVATVTSVYRNALDVLEQEGEAAYQTHISHWMAELNKASHRASNTGFYFGSPQPAAGAEGFAQTMEYVGDVVADAPAGEDAPVRLKNRFYVGDTLEVLSPTGARSFTVKHMALRETGQAISTASVAGTELLLRFPFAVSAGDILRGPNRNHLQPKG